MNNINFESPIEEIAYPIIKNIASNYDLEFTYQEKFGFQSGGYSSFEDYCHDSGNDYGNFDPEWEDSSWSCEIYRVDFTLKSSELKIAIELDGEEFHQDKLKDLQKDRYLKSQGFHVIRASGSIVVNEIDQLIKTIVDLIHKETDLGIMVWTKDGMFPKRVSIKQTLDYFIGDNNENRT